MLNLKTDKGKKKGINYLKVLGGERQKISKGYLGGESHEDLRQTSKILCAILKQWYSHFSLT